MIEKILLTLIAVVLVASAFAVPVYASSLDTVILPPDLGGFTDDMQDATFKYAKGLQLIFKNVIDLLDGKKTVSEFIDEGFALAEEYGLGFISDTLNAIDDNTITARELANIMTNALKKEIGNKGGNVSNFPLNDGGYWQVGNFTFKPLNLPTVNDCISENVSPMGPWSSQSQPCSGVVALWPDGTRYKNSTQFRVFGDVGTSQSLAINNIDVLFEKTVNVVIHFSISYSTRGASKIFGGSDIIKFDYSEWGDYTADDSQQITDTPDVDNLSDDDLIKYIDNIIKNLESTYPDLSTLEGLLQAILNQLKNNDGCDCSDVLAGLNAAIISLANDSNAQNSQIISLLQAIKDNVNNGSSTDLDPLLKKLDKIVADLDYLKMINTIELIADGWEKLTDKEKSYLDEYSKLIVTMGNKFGFTAINTVISSFNSIIFTQSPPRDLTIVYQGRTYVFLSTSTFGKFSSSVSTVRAFVSIVIIVSWAYSIRRKILEGI